MTIRFRINALFAVAALLILLSGGWSIYSLRLTSEAFEESHRQQERLIVAQRVAAKIVLSTQTLREYLASGSGEALGRALESNERVEQRLAELASTAVAPSERDAVSALTNTLQGYQRTIQRASFLNEKGQKQRAIRLVGPYLDRSLLPDVQAQVDQFIAAQRERAITAEDRLARATRYVTMLAGGSVLLMAGLGTALYLLLRRWLIEPVERLTNAARELGSGDLRAMRDINEHGELETLGHELASMADRLARTQSRLLDQERLAAMGELTFSVAHNVRNPLASVRALAQTSLRNPEDPDLKSENDRTILRTVDRLDRWLKDLLQSLRPIRVVRKEEDLGALVSNVVESLSTYAEQREIDLTFDPESSDLRASVDRRHLEQALLAVIANAIEASPASSRVQVSAKLNRSLRQVIVSILDEGPGISAEHEAKLFTPYFTTKKGGTGLGLSLARRVALSHEGRLDYVKRENSGAQFEFVVPIAPTDPSSGDRLRRDASEEAPPRLSKNETPPKSTSTPPHTLRR